MDDEKNPFLVSREELAASLGRPDLRIVDASWYLPAMGRDGKAEFQASRVPGAVYFDIDAIADHSTGLPHMLPAPGEFAAAMGAMGISESDDIVVYDGPGIFSCARAWWTFRVMGARRVRVLSGGFDGWKAAGLPVETGEPPARTPAQFNPVFQPERVRDFNQMLGNLKRGDTIVLDARPFGRFTGKEPEPRPGLRSGHMPGARSLPWQEVVRDGTLLPLPELRKILLDADAKPGRHVTTTCGSGVTAAILSLALESIGHHDHSLYDGSWAEWGAREDAPVAQWK